MLKTIGDVCQLLNGYSFKSEKYVDSGIRIIRIANVQKGFIEDNSPAFYPLETPGIENYMLKEGDLLISLTGNVGRVALLNKEMLPAALNQRVACLRIKDDSIYKNFLFHYLNSSKFENTCILESRGVAQKNMSTEWLKRQTIPNYTLQNQIKISKILDSIIEIINKKRQQLVEFDSLIKSRFVEMFGDPIQNNKGFKTKLFVEACPFNTYRGQVKQKEGKYWILNLDMIESNTGKVIEKIYQPIEEIGNSIISFDTDCVLYSKLRPYLNKVVIPDSTGYGTSELIHMKTGTEVNKYYLAELLRSNSFVSYINSKTAGAKMPRVSMDYLRNFKLMIPDMKDQLAFESFVKQVDKLKFIVQQSLDETQVLFDSLMQEYFAQKWEN